LVQRGCNAALAQRLADILEVDLEDLRTKYDDAEEAKTASNPGRPITAHRYVQRAYLRILLLRVVGSAYSTKGEEELERHCRQSPWEEVIEIVGARKRGIEFLRELMEDAQVSAGMPKQVRLFLEGTLETYPDLDLRLLATAPEDRSPPGRVTRRSRRPCAISCRCARTSSAVTLLAQAERFLSL
jgi:hypothetical protein